MTQTVMDVLKSSAQKYADKPALKDKRGGQWQTWTWRQYEAEVITAAKAFMKLGLEPGAGVAIIGRNRPEWFFTDLAAIYAGGFPAGIYGTNNPAQCKYIVDHCNAPIVVAENTEQLAKFLGIRDQMPNVKAFILMEGNHDDEAVYSWSDLAKLAEDVSDEDLQARIDGQKVDDVCTLIYTSGTTGQPKAVMLSHDNITWTAKVTVESVGLQPGESVLSYLPLSHIAEQVVSLHAPMAMGVITWFAESVATLPDYLREVRPHAFLGVPRVWEKIQAKMMAVGAQNTGLKKKIAAWARSQGLKGGNADQAGTSRPMLYGLADKLVFSKVREKLGLDRCRFQITAAAPISRDTLEFFLSLGIPVYEIYGMSECCGPATISLPTRYQTAKAGFCLPGGELKIAEDGEICMRGRHVFKGYYNNEEATAEALDSEGWLHSGDIGEIDANGFLQITDRKKDLLITAGGENIAPQLIEGILKSIPVISQAVVIGDRRKFLSALVTLDPERLALDLPNTASSAKDSAAAAADPAFNAWLMERVNEVNSQLARVQTIKKITILPQDLSIDGGEMTPTMKVKRKAVNTKYADKIEAMYA